MAYKKEEAAKLILETCSRLVEQGLIMRTWGNVSARIDGEMFLITPSGRSYDTMTEDDLVAVSIEDLTYESKLAPSSEKAMHQRIYMAKQDCNFVIHTHQPMASALSILGKEIDFSDESFLAPGARNEVPGMSISDVRTAIGDVLPCAEYAMASTDELARNVALCCERFPKSSAVLMMHHGACAFGETCEDAMASAEVLEIAAIEVYSEIVGREPLEAIDANGTKGAEHAGADGTKSAEHVGNDGAKGAERAGADGTKSAEAEQVAGALGPSVALAAKMEKALEKELETGMETQTGFIIHAKSPYIMEMSRRGKPVPSYLDDMAQLCGPKTVCLPAAPSLRQVANALKFRSAALIEGDGALCFGGDRYEAEAAATVLEKNCCAAILAGCTGAAPVDRRAANKDRQVYLDSYSKLRNE